MSNLSWLIPLSHILLLYFEHLLNLYTCSCSNFALRSWWLRLQRLHGGNSSLKKLFLTYLLASVGCVEITGLDPVYLFRTLIWRWVLYLVVRHLLSDWVRLDLYAVDAVVTIMNHYSFCQLLRSGHWSSHILCWTTNKSQLQVLNRFVYSCQSLC